MIAGLWECHVCGGLHRECPPDAVIVKHKDRVLGPACSAECAGYLYDLKEVTLHPLGENVRYTAAVNVMDALCVRKGTP